MEGYRSYEVDYKEWQLQQLKQKTVEEKASIFIRLCKRVQALENQYTWSVSRHEKNLEGFMTGVSVQDIKRVNAALQRQLRISKQAGKHECTSKQAESLGKMVRAYEMSKEKEKKKREWVIWNVITLMGR